MVGFLGLVLLKSTQVANHFKEEVVITLFLKNDTSKEQIENLRTSLLKELFTRKIIYISKGDAAKFYAEDLGEDFVNYLGTNPLKNSIDIYLNPGFVTPEKMKEISDRFNKNSFVFEVSYDKPLVTFLTQNIQKVSFWLFAISSFFGLIALILINSSIRLSVYSKRFNIKTMQMVGATRRFIRKPFINTHVKLGLIGSVIAAIMLSLSLYYIQNYFEYFNFESEIPLIVSMFVAISVFSVIITYLCTYFATQKFLKIKIEQLY